MSYSGKDDSCDRLLRELSAIPDRPSSTRPAAPTSRPVGTPRKNNVRLVVKSTEHDCLGRSIAPDSLSIWVHHMTGIHYHPDKFKLAGSSITTPGNAVTAGGSNGMYDLYKATAE
ncbi:FAD binding domain-containing protein [Colletotrichum orchidophilum]|uniref:FAD binding domain-containing protein n=1 Tax=Colletotrichum orchidophilum TaxID=1209926 RepID=A0A1G4BPM1_9PEZI|nr:FAD binding domain-containing protein [Colletotrichum orchidophilum]OHF03226.1 FAD binding domain-containing protein [Colletotrichum orchidophilum]